MISICSWTIANLLNHKSVRWGKKSQSLTVVGQVKWKQRQNKKRNNNTILQWPRDPQRNWQGYMLWLQVHSHKASPSVAPPSPIDQRSEFHDIHREDEFDFFLLQWTMHEPFVCEHVDPNICWRWMGHMSLTLYRLNKIVPWCRWCSGMATVEPLGWTIEHWSGHRHQGFSFATLTSTKPSVFRWGKPYTQLQRRWEFELTKFHY